MSDSQKPHGLSRRQALAGAAALGAAPRDAIAQTVSRRPNVVLIVLDDVGYADLGCYGSEIRTPAMDALAANGLRYTNFRTTGVCSATRASLYTGLNPHSAGIGWLTFADRGYPGYRGDLTHAAATLAETLGAHGYSAYHVGKWHVNADASITAAGPFDNWPLQRGYHRAWWFQGHSTDYFRPSKIYDGNGRVDVRGDFLATDAFTDHAIRFVKEHVAQAPERPFLLTLGHAAAHSPLHAPPADIVAQRGRYDEGWDRVRAARLARQKTLGVAPERTQLPPRNPGVSAWDDLSAPERRLYARYMEIYAAVIERLDMNIGLLAAALQEIGVLDDTLLLLLSDNGGSPDGALTGTPNLMAGLSGGVSLQESLAQLDELGGPNTYPMYPAGWSMASNTPFRLYKHDTHLGGVADPLIVHWPREIAARGEVRTHYAHVCDVFPTVLDCVRLPALRAQNGAATKPIQGVSFRSTFARADAAETRREQHFEMNGTRAFYADGWRLVSKGRYQQPGDGWELFNLHEDSNECNDLGAAEPLRVAALERRWLAAARRYDVLPIDPRSMREKSLARLLEGGGRARWTYAPPLDLIPDEAAPPLIGRAHSIDIELAASIAADVEGVLLAFGSMFLGHVLYVQRGKLVHEMACAPRTLRTEAVLPAGLTRIGLVHRITARPWVGSVALTADGRTLNEQAFDALPFGMLSQGLQFGRNDAVPVSRAYSAPFALTCAIRSVTIEVDTTPYSATETAAIAQPPRRG